MNICMCWIYLILVISILKANSAHVKLFHTEDALGVQSYDCIYYTNITAGNNETTPYCRRTNASMGLNRSFSTNTCENSEKEWSFKSLKEMNVSQDEVLTWSSSIEMADQYAAYLKTGHQQSTNDKICNCSLNTFGKFCEYEFMTMNTFEDAIQYQFNLKLKHQYGSQLWGNITCYTTLTDCYFGLRCLAWQNICDGKQQCMDGIDEDRCEELEFNECEENEYRCRDGSCISEQYWLDGQYDCSDKSDEQEINEHSIDSPLCPLISSQFSCDEATAPKYFACGDGQFVSNEITERFGCYNYRTAMFFCEFKIFLSGWSMWTLENGHCIYRGQVEKNLTDLNESEKCVFCLKCMLSGGKNVGCDDAIRDFHPLCNNKTISYPSGPLFKPYMQTVYQFSQVDFSAAMYVFFNGSIKCIGYQAHSESQEMLFEWDMFPTKYDFDTYFCNNPETKEISGPKFDKNCWNDTKESFRCKESVQCISKYRLGDSNYDCLNYDDESSHECHMKNKHRFDCSGELPLYLLASTLGDNILQCNEGNDEYIAQLKWILSERKCRVPGSMECSILKSYIQSSLSMSITESSKAPLFRQYCDTLWNLPVGFDESLCSKWKCPKDEYQCLSGHCIPLSNILFNKLAEWHCPDASDGIGLFRINELSEHNARLLDPTWLQKRKGEISNSYHLSYILPFMIFCNYTKEYGCILANVQNPSNFTENRPCINLTQIGDGIVDCYGGLDERNVLTCGNNTSQQRGFDFHCSDQECIPYHLQCEQRCSNNADSILCDQWKTLLNPSCKNWTRRDICTYEEWWECGSFDIRTYYCDTFRSTDKLLAAPYQLEAWLRKEKWIYLPKYPMSKDIVANQHGQPQQYKTAKILPHVLEKQENDGKEGWICGRGVAIKRNKTNTVQCFCPPSLYGEYCQYFNDRITVITSLYNVPPNLLEEKSNTIKILALLLSNDDIIDHHVFHLPLALSKELNKKFRFNLIYQKPKVLSNSYSVRFVAYHLSSDSSIKFIGVWEYSIQFPFLPSFRLAQVLKFEEQQTSSIKQHICQTSNPCLHGSKCYPIVNKMNDSYGYYCYCNIHSFGKQCEYPLQPLSLPTCSKHALLYPISSSKSICLCPIHSYGPTCHLKHTCAYKQPCGGKRGKCYTDPDNIIRDYICDCDTKFFGDQCEFARAMVRINFTDLSFVLSPSNFIMSSIIQLCDLHNETFDMIVRQKRVYQGLPPLITEIYHNDHYLPMLGIMKLYHQQHLSNDYVANLERPEYFVLYITSSNTSHINLTSVINMTNYCPYTSTIFQNNVSHSSYLSQITNSNEADSSGVLNMSVMIFKYHLLCDTPYSLMCFHDDNYLCLCDVFGHAECSRYDSTLDECTGQCLSGGQCVRGDLDDRKDFVCLCPRCYYGSICQHNTGLFSFTWETLLTKDLHSPSVVVQRLFFSLFIILPLILFLIGAVNNVCCYVTFNRKKPLFVGTGHYLRTTSIVSQLALFILLLKLIHIVLSMKGYIVHQMLNTVLCKVLPYLLSCASRMSYWLMGMVAIERVYVTWYLRGNWLKSPQIAKRIIAAIIVGIIVFDVHELIYYQSIEDPKSPDMTNSTWCVATYSSIFSIYNQVNIILNYIIPFSINMVSTIILIRLITQKRVTATTKKMGSLQSKTNARLIFRAYIDILSDNKELILAPILTLLFTLPQFILSFSLSCKEFKVNWQRYLVIICYFITYLPQVLLYKLYVSPSSFYKDEFHATKLSKKIYKWWQLVAPKQSQPISTIVEQSMDQTITRI